MTGIRILTVRQPWAHAIIHGGKDVENRTRSLGPYRGPVAIHAGAAWDWEATYPVGQTPHPTSASLVRGAIIGVVDLVDVHEGHNTESDPFKAVRSCYVAGKPFGACSPWAEADAHHLVLGNPRALDQPIPWKGGLGLRKSRLDIAGDWLVEATDTCTCGVGAGLGAIYGHEPGCGYEPVARLGAIS